MTASTIRVEEHDQGQTVIIERPGNSWQVNVKPDGNLEIIADNGDLHIREFNTTNVIDLWQGEPDQEAT